jgi:molybdate transport system permease protein
VTSPRRHSDLAFFVALALLGGSYIVLLAALLVADLAWTTPGQFWSALRQPEVRFAIRLSLLSSSVTTILSLWVAIPLGYLLARHDFRGRLLVEALLDVPIVLPPLVVGLSLLLLFQTQPGRLFQQVLPVTYRVPSVVLAQFAVACAFAVRTMRVTFEQIPRRREQVALTLGCSRAQAFWRVVLPEARRGVLTAATLCWARALGEFGPVLIFAGATHFQTEVLPTTVFLEIQTGNLGAAVAVSLMMIATAAVVLLIVRLFGLERGGPV